MLDARFIRENVDVVKEAIKNKNEKADVDRFLELDRMRKDLTTEAQKLKERKNKASEEIATTKKSGGDATAAITEMRDVSKSISDLDDEIRAVEDKLRQELLWMPNVPHESVPVGPDESYNVDIRSWGEKPQFDFTPAPQWELGEKLGLFDLARGAKVSGTGFLLFTGLGATLERALINFMIDLHRDKHGFTEVSPPFASTEESMAGTGQIPKLKDDMYRVEDANLYLIPTAEVPVTNIHRDEILIEADLPVKYVAYTPCFRREAGSHGKDTRGLMRVHQFDKVEMVILTQPEKSEDAHEELVTFAEAVLRALELPYRVRALATGDLSFAASKCYDLELYSAGVDKYLEVSSCS
ncbi:MAG: serine--tRNA ligase, partial [candidate division Zixibacteria bacterium]|nr:serine--tRNA ligase [candidate division Zixibacteria bacterium]